MRIRGRDTLKLAALSAALVMLGQPAVQADSSAANIKDCPAWDWCSYHRSTDKAWRHSPLDQINKDNVDELKPSWMFLPGNSRMGMQSTPIVVDGTMFVATNPSTVYALDAATGERKWAFVPDMDMAVVSRSFFSHTRWFNRG